MTENWAKAVEDSADLIGEMLVEMAEGNKTYTCEEIAETALKVGVGCLLEAGPSDDRVAEAASVLYEKMHDPKHETWASLSELERDFWIDIAQAATLASDHQLMERSQGLLLTQSTAD